MCHELLAIRQPICKLLGHALHLYSASDWTARDNIHRSDSNNICSTALPRATTSGARRSKRTSDIDQGSKTHWSKLILKYTKIVKVY
ncbi:Uncharacterized protein HZ326_6179 [Fusarium oxysporum f. sp. albedinis]|nr:Uncharacterized protein HZ326_6179 [Fusarium oxysporum f. sp. albedinis]